MNYETEQIMSQGSRGGQGPRNPSSNPNYSHPSQQHPRGQGGRPAYQHFNQNQRYPHNNWGQSRQPQPDNPNYQAQQPNYGGQRHQNRNNRSEGFEPFQPYRPPQPQYNQMNQQDNYSQGGFNDFRQQNRPNQSRGRDDSFHGNQGGFNRPRNNQRQYDNQRSNYQPNQNQSFDNQDNSWEQNSTQGGGPYFSDAGRFSQARSFDGPNNRSNYQPQRNNFRDQSPGGPSQWGNQDRRNYQNGQQRGQYQGDNRNSQYGQQRGQYQGDYANNQNDQQRGQYQRDNRNNGYPDRSGLFDNRRRDRGVRNDRFGQPSSLNRELTQEDLIAILNQKRDFEIENNRNLKIPHEAQVPILHPYIYPSHQARSQLVDLRLIDSLRGEPKVNIPNTSSKMNTFFCLPELQGAQEAESVRGFREATGIGFNEFQQMGVVMLEDIFRNFKTHFK